MSAWASPNTLCDPHPKPVWKREWRKQGRLVGWRLHPITHRFVPIESDGQGRLASVSLDSKLVMEGYANRELHLYDAKGVVLRLTPAQAQWERAEAERARAESERMRAETEREQARIERERAEAENQLRIAAEQRIKELEAKLRQLEDK